MYKFTKQILGLALAGMVLGACSQTATFEDADLTNELAAVEKAGFKLNPYSIGGNENALVYSETACNSECITKDPTTWYHIADRVNYNPQIYLDYDVYQSTDSIFYTLAIGASNSSSPTISKYLYNGVETAVNGVTAKIGFPLDEGWQKCDIVTRKFTVSRGGQGGGATIVDVEVTYKLIPICTTQEEEPTCTEAFRYERDETDPNIITFYYTPSKTKLSTQIQITSPQVSNFQALDGKTYTTFGNPSNGGLRWTGDLNCGQEISFKIKFTPDCNLGQQNLASTFNVKDLGGNQLTGNPIDGVCP